MRLSKDALKNLALIREMRKQMLTLIVSALGFTAALMWRDAFAATIDFILPGGGGLIYKYFAAIAVTVFAVVLTYSATRILGAKMGGEK